MTDYPAPLAHHPLIGMAEKGDRHISETTDRHEPKNAPIELVGHIQRMIEQQSVHQLSLLLKANCETFVRMLRLGWYGSQKEQNALSEGSIIATVAESALNVFKYTKRAGIPTGSNAYVLHTAT